MRTKQIFIIAMIAILHNTYSKAQIVALTPSESEMEHKRYLPNAHYIFEGKVINRKHYQGKNVDVITCIIQITKIYKGSPQINLGTVKVTIDQYIVSNGFTSIPSETGGSTDLNKGGTYIVFCTDATKPWIADSTTTDNRLTLTICGLDSPIIVNPANNAVNWFQTPQFKTISDIEAFFKTNGITIEQEAPTGSVK